MKKLFDPIANAKTLGFLFIIFGIIDVLDGLSNAISLVFGVIFLVVGFGLRKEKIWGLYALGVLTIVQLLEILMNNSQGFEISSGSALVFVFCLLLFVWLFSAKDRFKK